MEFEQTFFDILGHRHVLPVLINTLCLHPHSGLSPAETESIQNPYGPAASIIISMAAPQHNQAAPYEHLSQSENKQARGAEPKLAIALLTSIHQMASILAFVVNEVAAHRCTRFMKRGRVTAIECANF